jgi:YibE/F-like protein
VASTVNTLILAYVGASLPLLLFFTQGSQPIGRLLTGEVIAVEVVRMLVGSVGLVLSVPITTALAAGVLGVEDTDNHAGHDHGPLRETPLGPVTPARLSWREQRARDGPLERLHSRGTKILMLRVLRTCRGQLARQRQPFACANRNGQQGVVPGDQGWV